MHLHHQGDLDGLSGVYALINAVELLCGPLEHDETRHLFRLMLTHLDVRGPLARHCSDGILSNGMASLLSGVVCRYYPIQRFKPFHRQARVSKQQFLDTLAAFLQQPKRLALVGLSGRYRHWTLVYRVTDQTLFTYDSYALPFRVQQACSIPDAATDAVTAQQPILLASQTYLLGASV